MNTKDAWNKCPQCAETDTKILSSKQKFDIADTLLVIIGLLLMCGGIFLPASDFPPIIFSGLIWKILCIFSGSSMFWVMGLKKNITWIWISTNKNHSASM